MRKSCIKATCFLIFVLVNHFNLKAQQIIFTTSNFASGFDISCHGAADGKVEAAMIWEYPPFTFQWSNGAYTSQLNNITAGQYILTVTNAIAQTYTDTINLLEPEPLDAFVYLSDYFGSNISGNGRSDGEIILETYGGAPEYSYLWSNGASESRISNILAGTYTVTITDGNECTKTISRTLIEPQVLQITGIVKSNYNGYNVSCKDNNNGWAEVNVIGGKTPYSYRWSNGQFAIRAVDLSSGSHQIEVTDANNIKVVANIVLTQPTSLFGGLTAPIGVNGYHITCFQCANGTASTSANGGVTPYTYQWSNGSTASSVSGLSKGEYIVTVTDKNGCPHQSEFEITEPLRENWTMTGNANTNAAQEFIGTTDSTDFTFKTNSTDRLKIGSNGKIKFPGYTSQFSQVVMIDPNGEMRTVDIPYVPCAGGIAFPWQQSVNDPTDVFSCWRRFGIGTDDPQVRLEVKGGLSRFTSAYSSLSYVEIGHDGSASGGGNAMINNVGDGSLMINYNIVKDVKICTGNSGNLEVGGNTFLATQSGSVGIGTVNPQVKFEVKGGLSRFTSAHSSLSYVEIGHDGGSNGGGSAMINNVGDGSLMINYNNAKDVKICTGNSGNVEVGGNTFLATQLGKVGIGTSNPNHSLDVVGGINASDILIDNLSIKNGLWSSNSNNAFRLTGNIGIYTATPLEALQIGDRFVIHNGGNKVIGYNFNFDNFDKRIVDGFSSAIYFHNTGELSFKTANNDLANSQITWIESMTISNNGEVGIGTNPQVGYKLVVDGKIGARGLNLTAAAQWPDYVFDVEYVIVPFEERMKSLKSQKHLEGINTASSIQANGIEVSNTLLALTKHVEELYLYIEQLIKKVEALEKE